MTPELSRPFTLERIGRMDDFRVEASPAECAALAKRMGIPEVKSLVCAMALRRAGRTVIVEGKLRADVVQTCVVTLDPVDQTVDEAFTVHCVPEGAEDEGVSDDPDEPDRVPYTDNTVDLGELAAEQLALGLDPYPRIEGAELPEGLDDTNPFAALSALKRN